MKLRTTLDQWLVLKAVIEMGGFAQAAEFLNRSQSTISYAVSQLQKQLDVEILQIEGRKAVLTPVGKVLFHRACTLLENAKSLEIIAKKSTKGWPAEITIAVDDPFPREVLARALEKFAEHGQTRVQIYEASLSGTLEILEQGHTDIVVAFKVPKGHMEFAQAEIIQVAVAHKSHPLHNFSYKLNFDDLKNHLQFVVRDSAKNFSADMGWLEAAHRWTVASSTLSVNLIKQGLGFAWLPLHYVLAEETLKPLPLEISQTRRFFLNIFFGKKTPNEATLVFAKCLQESLTKYHEKLNKKLLNYLNAHGVG